MKLTRKKLMRKMKRSFWVILFIGITASWFTWATWDKVNTLLGNGNLAYMIAGLIILLAILFGLGHWSFKKLAERFT